MPDRTRKMVAVTTAEAGLDHSLPCPTCGATNPARSRFCSSCGARLEGAGAVREERKLVSVLFVDLVGFTARSDRADPEDVRELTVCRTSCDEANDLFLSRRERARAPAARC